jgi:phosphatidylserine decarboxylase
MIVEIGNDRLLIYNRVTQSLEEERVFVRWFMLSLYGHSKRLFLANWFGRNIWFSKLYGIWKRSPFSQRDIQNFIKNYQIDVAEIELPIEAYKTFNDFFTRKLKPESRSIDYNPNILISPADARAIIYDIRGDSIVPVKGKEFTLAALIGDRQLASKYDRGVCVVLRLSPVDYHRFCYIDDGKQSAVKVINGFLHSVSPLALRQQISAFTENKREFCILETENFGNVLHIDVGALTVGKIVQHYRMEATVKRGEEKGFFKLGGSTIVLLFEPGRANIDADIVRYSQKGIETLVKYGDGIGTKVKSESY